MSDEFRPSRWQKVACVHCGFEYEPWRTQDECPLPPYVCGTCQDVEKAYNDGLDAGRAESSQADSSCRQADALERIATALETLAFHAQSMPPSKDESRACITEAVEQFKEARNGE